MKNLNVNEIIPILQKMKGRDCLIIDEGLGKIIFNPDKYTIMKWQNEVYSKFYKELKNEKEVKQWKKKQN